MKYFVLGIILLAPFAFADDESSALEKIDEYAQKMKDLIDKYKAAEIDFVKQEVMTIKDTEGNARDCDVAIYYNNGKQARFTTKGGTFDGNFNHGKTPPTKPFSMRLSNCPCTPISTTHTATWLQIDEMTEKIKEVIQGEVEGKAADKAKEFAEKGVKKVFDKLGYGAAASGFLSGFGYGAALGAPIGDYITSNINKILDLAVQQNLAATEMTGDYSPLRPNVGWVKPRGGWGNFWGEKPQLRNKWDVTVRCGQYTVEPADATWVPIQDLIPKPQITTPTTLQTPTRPSAEDIRRQQEQERFEREQQQREEQERRDREAKAAREREEARKRYEEEQRQLRIKAQEIAQKCPICDPIRKQIEQLNENIKNKEQEIPGLENAAADAEKKFNDANKKLKDAQQRLNDFRNPRSWVESDGRRVTSSDLEVQRQLSIDNWNAYQRGEQSAQQTMDNWNKQSDPATHEAAKKRAEERLQKDVETAQQAVKQAEQALSNAKQALSVAKQQLENMKKELERLKKELEECLKKCKTYALQIAEGTYQTYEDVSSADQLVAKASTHCERYEKMIETFSRGRISVADYQMISVEKQLKFVSQEQHKLIEQERLRCANERGVLISPQPPTTGVTPQQPIQPKTCNDVCNARGMTTKQQDWNSLILETLNSQGKCKSSAKISYGQILTSGECTCYPTAKPSISISPELLVCKGTPCGDVPCDSSTECSCGANCIARVSCTWGGWQNIGQTYKPVVSAQTT